MVSAVTAPFHVFRRIAIPTAHHKPGATTIATAKRIAHKTLTNKYHNRDLEQQGKSKTHCKFNSTLTKRAIKLWKVSLKRQILMRSTMKYTYGSSITCRHYQIFMPLLFSTNHIGFLSFSFSLFFHYFSFSLFFILFSLFSISITELLFYINAILFYHCFFFF